MRLRAPAARRAQRPAVDDDLGMRIGTRPRRRPMSPATVSTPPPHRRRRGRAGRRRRRRSSGR
jgi:hypothetical protein